MELAQTNTRVGTFGICFHPYSTKIENREITLGQLYPPHGGITASMAFNV